MDHVVQQMAGAHREQDGIRCPLREARMSLNFVPNGVNHILFCLSTHYSYTIPTIVQVYP